MATAASSPSTAPRPGPADWVRARPLAYAAVALATAAVYFGAGKLGIALATVGDIVSPVWPPTGVAIAAVVLFGYRLAPAVFVIAFLFNLTSAGTPLTALASATGNTLEAVLGGYIARRHAHALEGFPRVGDVVRFALLASMAAPIPSATIGALSLVLTGVAPPSAFADTWFTWWLGNAAGALVVAPVILLWWHRPRPGWTRRQALEVAGTALLFAAAGWFIFSRAFPVYYVAIPPFLWVALRFGPRETVTASLLLNSVAVYGTLGGGGPFVPFGPSRSLLYLQGFIAVTTLTSWLLASVMDNRRRAEEDLRASREENMRTLFEASPDALVLAASDATILRLNEQAERLFGRARVDLAGQSLEALVPGLSSLLGRDATGANPDPAPATQLDAHGTGGRIFPVEITLRPLDTDGGAKTMVALRDVSERVRASAEREELQRLRAMDAFKTQFINMAAHELNTPLTPLKMQTHLLSRMLAKEGPQRRAVDILDRNVARVANLVQNMLDVGRIQSGRIELQRRRVDVHALAKEVHDSFEEAAAQAKVQLELAAGEPLWVDADAQRVLQVLFNLVHNALKFTPAGGTVVIETGPYGDQALVSVHDTGPGLSREQRARMFQPFTQVHVTSGSTAKTGTGLGLFISRQFVELHGGKLWAESQGPGTGSSFLFTLPMAASTGPVESAPAADAAPEAEHRRSPA